MTDHTPSTDIRIVRLLLTDFFGIPRAKTVTYDQYQRAVEEGHAWASPVLAADLWQNLPDDDRLGTGNTTIHPDVSTFTPLPWQKGTAVVLCGARPENSNPSTPRDALLRVLESAANLGLEPKFGPEAEFTLFNNDGTSPFGMDQWYTSEAITAIAPFIDDLYTYLPDMDIPVYEIFNEHGAGQMEINLDPAMGLKAWDRAVLMKLAIKEIAQRHGMRASFLSKPSNDPECSESGFHVHQTLNDSVGTNLFQLDENGKPSKEVAAYIGGQLAHASATTAFAAPTVTSYKRFRPGTWAPMRAAWGVDNRAAMVRLHVAGKNTRVENRSGASDANPYLLAAGQLAAGLDGIRRNLDPGDPASHNAADDPAYPLVPTNLGAALDALESDTLLTEAIGSELCELYVATQRQVLRRYQEFVTDWELHEYRSL
ncbi:glutamine synthetase family protein [Rhodococcus koreensis]